MDQRGFRQIGAFFDALSKKFTRETLYQEYADTAWSLQPSAFGLANTGITDRSAPHRWYRVVNEFEIPLDVSKSLRICELSAAG